VPHLNQLNRASSIYRPDIDGLRAVAVTAVLIFHAFPHQFAGGFVGVDIFFVISGFLISGIILKELAKGTFRFREFYSRRVRRIFPTLSLVLAVTLFIGWLTLNSTEFQQLSSHTVAGVGFVSNLVIWKEVGYFDASASTKPLLHLWSLGIEEQFYIAWPLLLALLWRWAGRMGFAIWAFAILSFTLNIALVRQYPEAVFYMPLTRIWELLIGAAMASAERNNPKYFNLRVRNALSLAGSLMILGSVALINGTREFPGWWALLPTAGSALIILAGKGALVNRTVLARRGVVWVGLMSYPLYLWHWPILTYFNLISDSDFAVNMTRPHMRNMRFAALAISFVAAWATWRFWETPLRNSKSIAGFSSVRALIVSIGIIGAVAGLAAAGVLAPRLNSPGVQALVRAGLDWDVPPRNNWKEPAFVVNRLSSASQRVTLFVGDSHADQYWPRVRAAIAKDRSLTSVEFGTFGGCVPLPGLHIRFAYSRCPAFNSWWVEQAAHADTVVISAYWESYFETNAAPDWLDRPKATLLNLEGRPARREDLDRAWLAFEGTLRKLRMGGKRIIVLSSNPASATFDSKSAFRRLEPSGPWLLRPVDRRAWRHYIEPIERRLEEVVLHAGAQLVRPGDYLCNTDTCPALDDGGEPLYLDTHHLRASTAVRKAGFIDEFLR
jgi:peptidoglycan/LPS O-acetylase OafA/YrhL